MFLSLVLGAGRATAEEAPEQPSSRMKELLKAKLAEEAKKKPATPAAAPADKSPVSAATPTAPVAAPAATTAAKAPASEKPKGAKDDPATVLPKVEVKRERITELDLQIQKQEHDIAVEKKATKATETDKALNDVKIAKPLAIFGGESSQFRERVASERVQLMEAEKDILEQMKLAKTKAERAELQKQLDELRDYRRSLEKSLR